MKNGFKLSHGSLCSGVGRDSRIKLAQGQLERLSKLMFFITLVTICSVSPYQPGIEGWMMVLEQQFRLVLIESSLFREIANNWPGLRHACNYPRDDIFLKIDEKVNFIVSFSDECIHVHMNCTSKNLTTSVLTGWVVKKTKQCFWKTVCSVKILNLTWLSQATEKSHFFKVYCPITLLQVVWWQKATRMFCSQVLGVRLSVTSRNRSGVSELRKIPRSKNFVFSPKKSQLLKKIEVNVTLV